MENLKLEQKYSWPVNDIVEGKWNQRYLIDKNAPFFFRVNDNHAILKKLQKAIKHDEFLNHLVSHQLEFTEKFKNTKFWLRVDEEVIVPMTLMDVYDGLIKHFKDSSFEDQLFNCHEISFVSPMGPFKHMPLIECINDELIQKYIFYRLIKNKLPMRKLRIHTHGEVLIQFGMDLDSVTKLNVRQVTEQGILFSSTEDLLLQKLSDGDMIKFLVDTRPMKKFLDNDLKMGDDFEGDFYYTEDELRYFYIEEKNMVKTLSYKSGKENEFFLFARYHHMLESDAPNIFMDFTAKVKEYFDFVLDETKVK